MEYYFNNLNPTSFQRLINGVLVARYGEDARLTPLRGSDGGRDAETAPGNPFFEYQVKPAEPQASRTPIRPGRYLFQVKHHRTLDVRPSDARASVVSDFERELKTNVLNRSDEERVNYFFLITNVPSSKNSILAVDQKRRELLKDYPNLHADIWWQEAVIALLDQTPTLWSSFPEMFAGNKVPFLADVVNKSSGGLSRAIRVAVGAQYLRDSLVKFKQIELEKSLTKLFVDLDVDLRFLDGEEAQALAVENLNRKAGFIPETFEINRYYYSYGYLHHVPLVSALGVLLSESSTSIRKILLEGGPGQGKSTITQMITQIYRSEVLLRDDLNPEERWFPPQKKRLPFRMELRHFAEWLGEHREASVEEYLASLFQKDSGGSQVIVDDIHSMVEHSPVLLIFDGLDEVGSSDLRDQVLVKIVECVDRFETTLHSDLKVVVTTRPPAIAGRREQLASFRRFPIAPMEKLVINSYLDRWLSVQVHDQSDRRDVHTSFERRRNETHVAALAKNPMQLSVLLHFIRLKGEAFPDRRAELYRDYFRTVIDRDVEKSSELRQKRELIETLHQLLGYKIHSLTEAEKADGTLRRAQLLEIVHDWMMRQVSNPTSAADEIFRLGEERLGLIVALKGEGEEATYGYEIQPIREYFAAAYINEQIQGDAHEVFQSLIGRPYWKEVALFLAGLRRPNEKADLLTRAKAVEREPEVPWRHDGRTIILQLLQEGVFSQPGHVFSEAVDFMIDLLDPSLVTIPNEPKELLEALPNLIEQGERARHLQRILRILDGYTQTDDAQILYRLHHVLSKLLPSEKSIELLLTYDGSRNDIRSWVRLYWPLLWGIDMQTSASKAGFWQPLRDEFVATYLWKSAFNSDLTTGIPLPQSIHQKLFERYALNAQSIFEHRPDRVRIMQPRSNLAIWQVVGLQQFLFSRALGIKFHEDIGVTGPSDFDTEGLDQSVSEVVKAFLPVLQALVLEMSKSSDKVSELLSDYILTLTKYMNQSGIAGLIAARTAMHLIELYRYAANRPPQTGERSALLNVFQGQGNLRQLSLALAPYFGLDHSEMYQDAFSLIFHRVLESGVVPTHTQLEDEGPFFEIANLFVQNVRGENELAFPWLKEMPISSSYLRPLVAGCQSNLEELLFMLSERQFETESYGRPLIVQSMQKILKLARTTGDKRLTEGALVALSSSKFLNLAGPQLTVKLIAAANTKLSIVQKLFKIPRRDSRESQILTNSALEIIKTPTTFPLTTRIAVANYLTEHLPVRQSPLIELEEKLGLQIQHREEATES